MSWTKTDKPTMTGSAAGRHTLGEDFNTRERILLGDHVRIGGGYHDIGSPWRKVPKASA